jgi:hypothetical protein
MMCDSPLCRYSLIDMLQGALPSRHFAGYINVHNATGRNLFYYMVESEVCLVVLSGVSRVSLCSCR